MLRARVRTVHRPFREFLRGVSGASVRWSRGVALPALADETCYRVLRDPSVIAVFGLTRPPKKTWPYLEDAEGDKLVEEVSKRLAGATGPHLTRESFSTKQRVALRGAEALATAIDFIESDNNDKLDELITRSYTWYAALKACEAAAGDAPARNGTSAVANEAKAATKPRS
jgi:hypothetical protein